VTDQSSVVNNRT